MRNRKFLRPITPFTTIPRSVYTATTTSPPPTLTNTNLTPTPIVHQPSNTMTDVEQQHEVHEREGQMTDVVVQEDTLEGGGDMAHTQLNQGDRAPGPRKSGRHRRQPRRLEDYCLGGLHSAVQDPPPGRR